MTYTAATKLGSLHHVQWSLPTAPNPTLSAPLPKGQTTIYFSYPLYDRTATKITGDVLIGVKNSDSYVETMYIGTGGIAADGLSATVVRGIRLEGLDYTTGDATLEEDFSAGDAVFCNISGVIQDLAEAAIKGTVATGGTGITIGTEPGAGSETITLYRTTTAGVKKGFFRWYVTSGKCQYSDDGTTWVNSSDVSASDLAKVSATDTTAGYLSDKLVSATGGIDFNIVNPGANETLNLSVDLSEAGITAGPLASVISDVTSSAAELNKLDTTSANVTATNLNTLTAGAASDASTLHVHSSTTISGVAYETITIGQPVCELPVECQWYTQLTEVATNLGATNGTRGFSYKFIPTKSVTTLANVYFRAAEKVNGATNLSNLIVTIQTDTAGKPSGTVVTNATSTISQVTQRTWNTTQATRTAALAGAVALTAGTTYHLCFMVSGTDAANYLVIGDASSYDENYLTFSRNTYDVDAGTWGNGSDVLPAFFWFDVKVGNGLVPTDADFGGRTWGFKGIATAGFAAQATATYYDNIVPTGIISGLVADTDYYISANAGTLTSTIPGGLSDFPYKIGTTYMDSTGNVLLKINKGEKQIWGTLAPTGSATTIHQVITWFNPKTVEIYGAYASEATILHTTISGIYDGVNNYQVNSEVNSGANNAPTLDTSYSFGGNGFGGKTWGGAGSSPTAAGFTYTVTKTSTPSDYKIIYKVKA